MHDEPEYPFPVTDPFDARDVTGADFEIDPNDDSLYVNLDTIRDTKLWDNIKFELNFRDNQLIRPAKAYAKIVFSGHRGSGKSTELRRFHKTVNQPQAYASIHIEIEKETEIAGFQPEDIYLLMITKLIERLSNLNLNPNSAALDEILKDWMTDEELCKEVASTYKIQVGAEAGVGGFFGILRLKALFKSVFSHQSKAAQILRQKIRKNPLELITRFNTAMQDIREEISHVNQGKDLLFILDGTEKIAYQTYQTIFLDNAHLIRSVQAHILFAIPINAHFDIRSNPATSFTSYSLPMVPIDEHSKPILKSIIANRVDTDRFFEAKALDLCIEKSGGCPRQLLRIVNQAITETQGAKVTHQNAQQTCERLGRGMWDLLTSEHVSRLRKREFGQADAPMLELLFSLVVLKYNGVREINPLIQELVEGQG